MNQKFRSKIKLGLMAGILGVLALTGGVKLAIEKKKNAHQEALEAAPAYQAALLSMAEADHQLAQNQLDPALLALRDAMTIWQKVGSETGNRNALSTHERIVSLLKTGGRSAEARREAESLLTAITTFFQADPLDLRRQRAYLSAAQTVSELEDPLHRRLQPAIAEAALAVYATSNTAPLDVNVLQLLSNAFLDAATHYADAQAIFEALPLLEAAMACIQQALPLVETPTEALLAQERIAVSAMSITEKLGDHASRREASSFSRVSSTPSSTLLRDFMARAYERATGGNASVSERSSKPVVQPDSKGEQQSAPVVQPDSKGEQQAAPVVQPDSKGEQQAELWGLKNKNTSHERLQVIETAQDAPHPWTVELLYRLADQYGRLAVDTITLHEGFAPEDRALLQRKAALYLRLANRAFLHNGLPEMIDADFSSAVRLRRQLRDEGLPNSQRDLVRALERHGTWRHAHYADLERLLEAEREAQKLDEKDSDIKASVYGQLAKILGSDHQIEQARRYALAGFTAAQIYDQKSSDDFTLNWAKAGLRYARLLRMQPKADRKSALALARQVKDRLEKAMQPTSAPSSPEYTSLLSACNALLQELSP